MARSKPAFESPDQRPSKGVVIAEAKSGGSSVSPVAIMQEQLASRLAGEEHRWSPRAAFWVSVGSAAAIWLAVAAAVRAAL